jgi:hypothetical protein
MIAPSQGIANSTARNFHRQGDQYTRLHERTANKFHGFSTGGVRQLPLRSVANRLGSSRKYLKISVPLCPKKCGRILGEIRPLANPVWGRGGVGT